MGELNWIFTAITDTIAWIELSKGLRQGQPQDFHTPSQPPSHRTQSHGLSAGWACVCWGVRNETRFGYTREDVRECIKLRTAMSLLALCSNGIGREDALSAHRGVWDRG